jgi:hypothetical protein
MQDIDEVKEQVKDSLSRVTQLVSLNYFTISAIGCIRALLTFTRLRDCDVTWLYKPLQTESDRPLRMYSSAPASGSHTSKFNSSIVKQAATIVQAQEFLKLVEDATRQE